MDTNRDVLEFDCGVRVYPPPDPDGYWRVRWEEAGRRRDTSARSRTDAIAKATEVVERLGRGTRTDLAKGALNQPGLRLEDVSRLLGHSSTRVTQDIYIQVHGDLYQRSTTPPLDCRHRTTRHG